MYSIYEAAIYSNLFLHGKIGFPYERCNFTSEITVWFKKIVVKYVLIHWKLGFVVNSNFFFPLTEENGMNYIYDLMLGY